MHKAGKRAGPDLDIDVDYVFDGERLTLLQGAETETVFTQSAWVISGETRTRGVFRGGPLLQRQ